MNKPEQLVFEPKSSAHILLTGGTGFFGRALLRTWLNRHIHGVVCPMVTVLTRTPEIFLKKYPEFDMQPWLRFHTGDICHAHTLPYTVHYTHILHAAADSTLSSRLAPLERYDQIVGGTRNLLDLAVICGAQRFLFVSSGAVYGLPPASFTKIPENWMGIPDPLKPINIYGNAKRAAEHLCALYGESSGLHTVIARCFAFVGHDLPLDAHFAIGNFIRDALYGTEIVVAGDGASLRSYLDQQDLAHWLLTLLEMGQAGQAYNVGSDYALSIFELANLVQDVLAPSKPVQILGLSNSGSLCRCYVPDINSARSLGLDVTISLRDAIRRVGDKICAFKCLPS